LQAVGVLARAIDLRDLYTGQHSEDVEELAHRVGVRLGMASQDLGDLELAARLHDVGKLSVPDAILCKAGPLEHHEWRLMRSHAQTGAAMIARVRGLERVARIVRSHHERWDGRGYPDGLVGRSIPLASRVVAVCDAYRAMTVRRPYREALEPGAALIELRRQSGRQFDPAVVAALMAEFVAGREGPLAAE
jgi:HD-GYP domain-containing protein (c-di-GMP phosphodiesterase class II)